VPALNKLLVDGDGTGPRAWTASQTYTSINDYDDGGTADSSYVNPTADNNYTVDTSFTLSATNSDFGTMTALTLSVRNESDTQTGDDTMLLAARVVKRGTGGTLADGTELAGASGGGFQDIVSDRALTSWHTFPGIGGTGDVINFGLVHATADKGDWDAAQLELRVTHSKVKGANDATVRVSAVKLTGTYDAAILYPTITNAEDEDFRDGETAIQIEGTNFGATQGSATIKLDDSSDTGLGPSPVTQTITGTWSDTGAEFTCVLGSLTPGPMWLYLTNDTGLTNQAGYAVSVHRKVAFRLKASANIAAAAATATTAQLTAPASKDFGWFDSGVGRISDDTNPITGVDMGADLYTAFEWCLEAVSGVNDTGTYEFRLSLDGQVPTQDQIATATIGLATGANVPWLLFGGGS
jgi:hypothetical protein